jgi:nucleoside-diphosphate-sugar epimerase
VCEIRTLAAACRVEDARIREFGAMPVTGHRVVVVGGAGLVGSAVARALADDAGVDVVVCDRLGPAAAGKWRGLPARLDDLWQPHELMEHLERAWRSVSAVVVLADGGSEAGDADGDALFRTAFHLPRQLFAFASARQRPLVWASTAQVYGAGEGNLAMDPAAIAALKPLTAFGRAHQVFDLFAARQSSGPDAPPVLTGLRLGSVYGSGEGHKGAGASLPVRALAAVRAGEPVPVWRSTDPALVDGGHRRDWVQADDAGRMIAALITGGHGGFFDIGTGHCASALEVVQAAARAASRQARIAVIEPPAGAATHHLPPANLAPLAKLGIGIQARTLDDGLAGL